jgi:hypothetical protein
LGKGNATKVLDGELARASSRVTTPINAPRDVRDLPRVL